MFRGKAEKKVLAAGYDPARLPPGQYLTEKWPVLHAGSAAKYPADLAGWDFTVSGEVDTPLTLTWEQLSELPRVEVTQDIHCVTRWSRFDASFAGHPLVGPPRARRPAPDGALRDRACRGRLHVQRPDRVPRARGRDARNARRRRAAEQGSRLAAAADRAREVLLEEREVAARDRAARRRTVPASGSATGTTTTPTRSRRSATRF